MVHRSARRCPASSGGTVATAAIITIALERRVRHVPVGVDRGVAQRAQLVVQRERYRLQGHRTWGRENEKGREDYR